MGLDNVLDKDKKGIKEEEDEGGEEKY